MTEIAQMEYSFEKIIVKLFVIISFNFFPLEME